MVSGAVVSPAQWIAHDRGASLVRFAADGTTRVSCGLDGGIRPGALGKFASRCESWDWTEPKSMRIGLRCGGQRPQTKPRPLAIRPTE